jgi:hypothetical protein
MCSQNDVLRGCDTSTPKCNRYVEDFIVADFPRRATAGRRTSRRIEFSNVIFSAVKIARWNGN